ncbi:BZ3500_MvSof-1268-A1-R1_Chr9g10489 [Microbotryum saponariae]|uniref:Single-stranded DNA-binding protein n=1 Tax=Microbotryum saponariae TaxID=289078 RepID=A0A2X0KBC3_9BASI|nr:BZ3501_MvSof-1269-A2-R1_Chr9g10238 [Microbotryum saponariae]SDA00181.1 BZ3500_MvSof-1268-A1-R1_Chr9g10489 [Microbotryum saponariae]
MIGALRPSATRAFSQSAVSARDLARVTLIGRLGGAPEKRQTKNGKDFLIYKVATNDPMLPAPEGAAAPAPTTSWHTIFAYGPGVERLETLEKGALVHVEAQLTVKNSTTPSGEYKTDYFAKHERLMVIRKPTQTAA